MVWPLFPLVNTTLDYEGGRRTKYRDKSLSPRIEVKGPDIPVVAFQEFVQMSSDSRTY